MTAAEQEEILRPELLANLVFVRQVVADGRHVEVTRFHQHFDRLHDGWLKRLLLVPGVPRGLLFEIGGVLRQLLHGIADRLVGDGDEALRAAFRAARVAIDLDETVREINRGIVADPVGAE